jgi:hypothetical protein
MSPGLMGVNMSKTMMLTITIATADGHVIAVMQAPRRTFKSQREGYGAYGRTLLPDGEALQMSLNLTVPGKVAQAETPAYVPPTPTQLAAPTTQAVATRKAK